MGKFSVALCVCAIVAGCHASAVTESATKTLSKQNVLMMERKAAHPYSAEYDRTLKLVANGKVLAQCAVNMDTGGYKSAKLFRRSNNEYVVFDSFDTYVITLAKPQITQKDIAANQRGMFIGTFDENSAQDWSFIPASGSKRTKSLS